MDRRKLLEILCMGTATSAVCFGNLATQTDVEAAVGLINANSQPSKLKITDMKEPGYFEPNPEWDNENSWDRTWSYLKTEQRNVKSIGLNNFNK